MKPRSRPSPRSPKGAGGRRRPGPTRPRWCAAGARTSVYLASSPDVNGISGTLWVSAGTPPAPTQILAATNDGTTALYYEVRSTGSVTPQQTVRITFLKWQTTFKQEPNLFKPPGKCLK